MEIVSIVLQKNKEIRDENESHFVKFSDNITIFIP